MASSSALPIFNKGIMLSTRKLSSSNFHSYSSSSSSYSSSSSPLSTWGSKRNQDVRLISQRTKSQEIRVFANPNVSPEKRNSNKEVIMVDPLEAKRLAAKQMEKIKAKEKYRRQRRIEAINGAWAMIGLTAGLVIEGHTGNTILAQLAGYWAAFISFFMR